MNILPIHNYIYGLYVKCAKRRNKVFNLDKITFVSMISNVCYYCGAAGSNKAERKSYAVKVVYYNGIDRIDSDGAYEKGNVVTCCKQCNAAKSDQTVEAFESSDWLAARRKAVKAVRTCVRWNGK